MAKRPPSFVFDEQMNNNFANLSIKDKVSLVLCILAFVFGMVLTILGMTLPPLGEIHPSVITCLGMFLTFSGSILGISMHYKLEMEKFKSDISRDLHP